MGEIYTTRHPHQHTILLPGQNLARPSHEMHCLVSISQVLRSMTTGESSAGNHTSGSELVQRFTGPVGANNCLVGHREARVPLWQALCHTSSCTGQTSLQVRIVHRRLLTSESGNQGVLFSCLSLSELGYKNLSVRNFGPRHASMGIIRNFPKFPTGLTHSFWAHSH